MVHVKTHQRELIYPCREAKKYNCKRLFSNLGGVGQHLRTHTRDVEPTEDERQLDVSGWANMRYHPVTSQFYCTVPACVNAVTRQSISYRYMAKHMAAHKAHGHLENLLEGLYQPEETTIPHSVGLHKDLDEDEDVDEEGDLDEDGDVDEEGDLAYGDGNDYGGEADRALGVLDVDDDVDHLQLQEMSRAPPPNSKESREATKCYNNSLRGMTQYCIYCILVG